MEQQDFTPIGGSWQQDAAYSLRQIIEQANELLIKVDETGNQISSAITESETIVEVTTYNYANKGDVLFVYNPLPIVTPKPKQTVVYKTVNVKPPTRVIDVSKQMAYSRVCGAYPSPECIDCVDKWLEDHKDGFELRYLTAAGTGCNFIRKIQQSVSSKCNPPSSIVDRAAVKAYRQCMQKSK